MLFPVAVVKSHFSQLLNKLPPLWRKSTRAKPAGLCDQYTIYGCLGSHLHKLHATMNHGLLSEERESNHLLHLHISLNIRMLVKIVSGLIKILTLWRDRANSRHGATIVIPPGGDLLACCTHFAALGKFAQKKCTTPSYQFPGGSSWRVTTTMRVTARRCNLTPSHPDSKCPQQQQRRRRCYDGGRPYWRSLLLYRRNNRLRIFLFIFFRESERGEAARIEKKTFHLEFHIQALAGPSKEPLRCGFKRNSLCGTGAGRKPSMEETLQCVSARRASDLACCLKLGVGKGNGTFRFCFFFCFVFFWGRIFFWRHAGVSELVFCQIPPASCHGFWARVRTCVYVVYAITIPAILPF